MIVYFISFIITLIFCFFATHLKNKIQRKFFMLLSIFPFFLVAALRYNVGIDTWLNYGPTFDKVAQYGDRFDVIPFLMQKYEIGFSIIVFLLARVCKSSTILFTFGSAIVTFFTFFAIYRQSKIPWLSITIFFLSGAFLLSMNGMRNYMAIAIVIYSLKYIYDKKFLKFLLCILLAASIHKSILILILLYPLYNLKIDIKFIIIGFIISIITMFFINGILSFILSKTSYINYFNTDKIFVDPLYSMLVINIMIFILFLFNYNNYKNNKEYNFYLKLQMFSVIICIFSFKLSLSYRLEQIIDFFQIITIPNNIFFLKQNKNFKKSIVLSAILTVITIFSVYFTKVFIFSDDNQLKNYSTIFNKE